MSGVSNKPPPAIWSLIDQRPLVSPSLSLPQTPGSADAFALKAMLSVHQRITTSSYPDRTGMDGDLDELEALAQQVLNSRVGLPDDALAQTAKSALGIVEDARSHLGDQGVPKWQAGQRTARPVKWPAAAPKPDAYKMGADANTFLDEKRPDKPVAFVDFKDSGRLRINEDERDATLKHPTNEQIAKCLARLPAYLRPEIGGVYVMSKAALDKDQVEPVAGAKLSDRSVLADQGAIIFPSREKPVDDAQLYRDTLAAMGESVSARQWGPELANPAAWMMKKQSQWTAAALADGFHIYDAATGALAQQSPQRDFGQFYARVQDALDRNDLKAIERLRMESPARMRELSARTPLLSISGSQTRPNLTKAPKDFVVPDPKWMPVNPVPSTLSEAHIKDGERVRSLAVEGHVIELVEPKPSPQSEEYVKQLAAVIPLLPPMSREALKRVLASPHPHDNAVAAADSANQDLVVYPNAGGGLPSQRALFANMLHETGHLVHFAIGNANRTDWGSRDELPFDSLWELAVQKDGNHSSEYGMSSPMEDFAEAYTEYWLARLAPNSDSKAEIDRVEKSKPARGEILDHLAGTSLAALRESAKPYKR